MSHADLLWLDCVRVLESFQEPFNDRNGQKRHRRYSLVAAQTSRAQTKVTPAMQHGTAMEPATRAAYETQTGLIMQPVVLEDGNYSASLDGMTIDGGLVLEIKCPLRGAQSDLWQDVSTGQVPAHYMTQVQHQLMVSGAETAHLWVFDGINGLLHTIERDEAAMNAIREGWDNFQQHLDKDIPPPLTDADTVVRDDRAWSEAAAAFTEAKTAADAADAALAQAKERLVSLAQHPREAGAGVCVTRFWKAGSVAYKNIPELKVVDLDAYRAKAREEVRVSIA